MLNREKGTDGQRSHLIQSTLTSQVRNCTSVISVLRKLRQKDHKLMASLVYIARSYVKIKPKSWKWLNGRTTIYHAGGSGLHFTVEKEVGRSNSSYTCVHLMRLCRTEKK